MTIKGILFDKDGTLIDFHATWMPVYQSASVMLATRVHKPELAHRLMAMGGYDPVSGRCAPWSPLASGTTESIARLWVREAGLEDEEAEVQTIEALFNRHVATHAIPVTDLVSLFERLLALDIVLGVATMDSEASARATLSTLQIHDKLSFLCGYDSGYGEKPHPGMIHAFCAQNNLQEARVAVVGDTPRDLEMARAAHVGFVIGVLTGASLRPALEGLADHVLASIAEIESILS